MLVGALWKRVGKNFYPAAPFFYVEIYHSGLDWMLYPDSHLFVSKVDELTAAAAQFPTYFRRCKSVVSALKAAMPKGSGSPPWFPRFPTDLAEEPVQTAPLSKSIKNMLGGYRSADR